MRKQRVMLLAACLALVIGGILRDPLMRADNASDAVGPAPLWQVAAFGLDILILVSAIVLLLLKQWKKAGVVVILSIAWSITLNIVLIRRLGIARFAEGFAGSESLSLYLAFIGARALVLFALLTSRQSESELSRLTVQTPIG